MRATLVFHLAAAFGSLVSGCTSAPTEPITMSVISASFGRGDPNSGPLTDTARVALGAMSQSLVSLDSRDQIKPGLAERWIITDDGLSYIFRIRRARWPDKHSVTSADVARSLRQSIAPGSRNRLGPMLYNIAAIVPRTAEVLEIQLRAPEPNLLQLLAQPELAISKGMAGTGPFAIHSRKGNVIRLRPIAQEDGAEEQAAAAPESADIRVRAESPAEAILRFKDGATSYVSGGRFTTLPYAKNADISSSQFKLDPTYGLFGLGISAGSQLLASEKIRIALSSSIDREGLTQRFGLSDWRAAISIIPAAMDSASQPAALLLLQRPIAERRQSAKAAIAKLSSGSVPLKLRVALPPGPGSQILLAYLRSNFAAIGLDTQMVALGQPADLVLIDEIAPTSSAIWYLSRLSCGRGLICDPASREALTAVFAAPTQAERALLIAKADAAAVSSSTFIPLARPLRWSLVSSGLTGWRPSSFAIHDLTTLR